MKEVILTTTSKINAETAAFLEEKITENFSAERIVRKTDDSIVGGFTLQCGGVFYDMSIKAQLSGLRDLLDSQESER